VNLFDSLTVRENVEFGAAGAMAGGHLIRQIAASRPQVQTVGAEATAAMEVVGITDLAKREARFLSTGQNVWWK